MFALQGLLAAVGPRHTQGVRVDDPGKPLDVIDLAVLGELSGAGRQPLHDGVLELAKLGQIDLRLPELDPPGLRMA